VYLDLEMTPLCRSHTRFYSSSIVSNYGHILYRFRAKAIYRSKIAIFHAPLHITTLWATVSNIFALFSTTEPDDHDRLDPGAAEFGRRRRILCVSRKSAEKKSAKPYGKRRLSRRKICRLRVSYLSGIQIN